MKRLTMILALFTMMIAFEDSFVHAKTKIFPWTRAQTESEGPAQSIGGYAWGCLQGASKLPSQGEGFRSIRRHRHRYFAHPITIKTVIELAKNATQEGLLPIEIGDLSQPRGGRMKYGHRSHQSGLDIDIWFGGDKTYRQEEAKRRLSKLKRKAKKQKWNAKKLKKRVFDVAHPSVMSGWREKLDTKVWSSRHETLLKLASKRAEVARIFVHFRIKEKMCERYKASAEFKKDPEPLWLRKLRPWYGHHQHFHIRLHCPKDSPECDNQGPLPTGLGCDNLEWFSKVAQKKRKKTKQEEDRLEDERLTKLTPQELKRIKRKKSEQKKVSKKSASDRLAKLLSRCSHLAKSR